MRIINVLLVSLVSLPAWATSAPAAAPTLTAPELEKLFSRYQGLRELSVDFEQQKILKDVPTPLISKGHLMVKTPDESVWTISKPSHLEVKMQGGNVQITTGEGASADVQKLSRAQLASNPQSRSLDSLTHWLQFDSKFLNSEYTVEKLSANRYGFKPKHESPFNEMSVELGTESTVKTVEINEKSGDRLVIKFEKPTITKVKK